WIHIGKGERPWDGIARSSSSSWAASSQSSWCFKRGPGIEHLPRRCVQWLTVGGGTHVSDTPHGLKPDGCSGEPSAIRLLPGRRRERAEAVPPPTRGRCRQQRARAALENTTRCQRSAPRPPTRGLFPARTSARGTPQPYLAGT